VLGNRHIEIESVMRCRKETWREGTLAGMLDPQLSSTIRELYRGAREVPVHLYQGWAMERLQGVLRFDSGLWVTGYVSNGMVVHTQYLHSQPVEMMENYEQFKAGDQLAILAVLNPGRTLELWEAEDLGTYRKSETYMKHCRPFDIREALVTFSEPHVTGLQSGISCCRGRDNDPFSVQEKQKKNLLFRHLTEAFTINQLLFVEEGLPGVTSGGATAIVDRLGYVLQFGTRAGELMVEEWPSWDGVRLPEICREAGARGEDYAGRRVVASFSQRGSLTIVTMRYKDILEGLTRRQREIAELLAMGMTYKEIAVRLGLSVSTITNQANPIYRRTATSGKVALARLLQR